MNVKKESKHYFIKKYLDGIKPDNVNKHLLYKYLIDSGYELEICEVCNKVKEKGTLCCSAKKDETKVVQKEKKKDCKEFSLNTKRNEEGNLVFETQEIFGELYYFAERLESGCVGRVDKKWILKNKDKIDNVWVFEKDMIKCKETKKARENEEIHLTWLERKSIEKILGKISVSDTYKTELKEFLNKKTEFSIELN